MYLHLFDLKKYKRIKPSPIISVIRDKYSPDCNESVKVTTQSNRLSASTTNFVSFFRFHIIQKITAYAIQSTIALKVIAFKTNCSFVIKKQQNKSTNGTIP